MQPGEYLIDQPNEAIAANLGRASCEILVAHTGDRPIQVGSHYHFFEVNRALVFDRSLAYGMHLNIPAGTAVRFEPGDSKIVTVVAFAGTRQIYGHNGLVNGALDAADQVQISLSTAQALQFGHRPQGDLE
ncbi:urease subunit beta [Herpetosiphon sp. NSE202]|uniref:urease subunit beta n=1 Tax=Herpetosiphon sp. NSE202 TaxID=3351349 RepID=UPI0036363EC7